MRLKNFSLPVGRQIFKALSDDARIRILVLLFENGRMCVSDLELILDFTQAKTSRHMTYLKNSGIVTSEKADQWVFYYIKDEVMDIIGRMLEFMEKDITLTKDRQTFKTLYSNRELALFKVDHARYR
ncbi:hypothetical protein FUAX_06080 [Fulvitalea axinellae]|uniref:HTH arsR-type domain-containing protein n=1 Tax=Fulvitalea axinellae TaxID=1182444 RepID=A0AAU9CHD4_9BACT|nr:hypothetical protein FUAX_06080 [Fulvitalea axinellae]